jgi:hypothetical protein
MTREVYYRSRCRRWIIGSMNSFRFLMTIDPLMGPAASIDRKYCPISPTRMSITDWIVVSHVERIKSSCPGTQINRLTNDGALTLSTKCRLITPGSRRRKWSGETPVMSCSIRSVISSNEQQCGLEIRMPCYKRIKQEWSLLRIRMACMISIISFVSLCDPMATRTILQDGNPKHAVNPSVFLREINRFGVSLTEETISNVLHALDLLDGLQRPWSLSRFYGDDCVWICWGFRKPRVAIIQNHAVIELQGNDTFYELGKHEDEVQFVLFMTKALRSVYMTSRLLG